MAKIRSLKGEFFRHAAISRGGPWVKILAGGLIAAVADDEGRFKASPDYLRGEIFTHDQVDVAEVDRGLQHLQSIDFIRLYHVQGRPFGVIKNWKDHQPVPPSRFVASKLPPPPNTKPRKQSAGKAQAVVLDTQAPASSRAGVGSDRKEDRIGIHGDVVMEAVNGIPAAHAHVPANQDVTTVCLWLLDQRGWASFGALDVANRERLLASQMLDLMPLTELLTSLAVMWDETDPDDRPSSLGYFWTRLQDEAHAELKQPRPHARTDGLSRIAPVMPAKKEAKR